MAKGDITIDETQCKGCGLCDHFCPHGCFMISGDRFTQQGYLLPLFADSDKCTGCGICGWMCPDFAIEVYKYVEKKAPST